MILNLSKIHWNRVEQIVNPTKDTNDIQNISDLKSNAQELVEMHRNLIESLQNWELKREDLAKLRYLHSLFQILHKKMQNGLIGSDEVEEILDIKHLIHQFTIQESSQTESCK